MENWIMDVMNAYGYLGVAILITVENIFPPIPSEVILTFGGFMTTFTKMNVIGVILSATVGSVAGAIILYEAGRIISPAKLQHLLSGRVGRWLHFKPEDVEKSICWFDSQGNYTVLLCRCIPIVRSLISIPAGMARMELGKFLVMTTVGSLIWNIVLVTLGAVAGASWQRINVYMETYSDVAGAVIAIGVVIGIALFVKKRFFSKR